MQHSFVRITLSDQDLLECLDHGRRMAAVQAGFHNVRFRDNPKERVDSVLNYIEGKIGEKAVEKWLRANSVVLSHTPFRDDYSLPDLRDDFLVRLHGDTVQIEVKTKTRNSSPEAGFTVCLESLQANRLYVFVHRQRQIPSQEPLDLSHLRGMVTLVGWISPELALPKSTWQPRGTQQTDPMGRPLFVLGRDEFHLKIGDLQPMALLLSPSVQTKIPRR